MRAISVKYHEVMFNFWYCRNSTMRDYHGRKYHQLLSMPSASFSSGLNFRNCKRDIALAVQSAVVVVSSLIIMLALVAQFA